MKSKDCSGECRCVLTSSTCIHCTSILWCCSEVRMHYFFLFCVFNAWCNSVWFFHLLCVQVEMSFPFFPPTVNVKQVTHKRTTNQWVSAQNGRSWHCKGRISAVWHAEVKDTTVLFPDDFFNLGFILNFRKKNPRRQQNANRQRCQGVQNPPKVIQSPLCLSSLTTD